MRVISKAHEGMRNRRRHDDGAHYRVQLTGLLRLGFGVRREVTKEALHVHQLYRPPKGPTPDPTRSPSNARSHIPGAGRTPAHLYPVLAGRGLTYGRLPAGRPLTYGRYRPDARSHTGGTGRTPAHLYPVLAGRPLTYGRLPAGRPLTYAGFSPDARSLIPGIPGTPATFC